MTVSTILLVAVVLLTIIILVARDLWRLWHEPRLCAVTTANPAVIPPALVVIPARNEATRIGACLAGLAAQQGRQFRVVVVDDGSTDGTAAIARSYADRIPDLVIITGAPLPVGWAGKPWACWQGAAHAQAGEDLVFLDADVIAEPNLLAALSTCNADLVSLLPRQHYGTVAERLVVPVFLDLITAITPFTRVNDPTKPDAFAIGQCMSFSGTSYCELGGHAVVRDSVLEDMHLARHAKAIGLRLQVLAAPSLIAVRMYDGWGSIVAGLGKNAVAGLHNAGGVALWHALRASLLAWAPLWLLSAIALRPADSALLGSAAVVCLLITTLPRAVSLHRRSNTALHWALAAPLGLLLYFGIATITMLRVALGRGVVWKGRRLPGT